MKLHLKGIWGNQKRVKGSYTACVRKFGFHNKHMDNFKHSALFGFVAGSHVKRRPLHHRSSCAKDIEGARCLALARFKLIRFFCLIQLRNVHLN